ncbi:hypothetical protein D3C80_1126730 [compost metagenome]
MAHSAGVSVSATRLDSVTAVESVTANWRYSSPTMPGSSATGINTASSTSVVAITGPAIWRSASAVAAVRLCPSAIRVSTFSTTTIASSTTIVSARIMANRLSVLAE